MNEALENAADALDEARMTPEEFGALMAQKTGGTLEGCVRTSHELAEHIGGPEVQHQALTEGLTQAEWRNLYHLCITRPHTMTIEMLADTARRRATSEFEDPDLAYEESMVRWAKVAAHACVLEEAFTTGFTTEQWVRYADIWKHETEGE